MSAISREAPARMRVPSPAGVWRKRPAAPATSSRCIRRATTDGNQEILLEEVGERLADAVLVARDDRGVRDRQAERVAEQGGDREPVGEAADHRRFGEGLDVGEPGIARLERARGDEHRGHHHQQPGRDRPSSPARPAAPG